jgi:hypothetical protein
VYSKTESGIIVGAIPLLCLVNVVLHSDKKKGRRLDLHVVTDVSVPPKVFALAAVTAHKAQVCYTVVTLLLHFC